MGLLGIAVLANGALAAAIVVTRDPTPGAPSGDRIEAASKPAIVMVQTDYAVTASIPDMVISDAKYNQVVNQIQAMWAAGQLSSNAQAYRAAINLVVSNPGAYFSQGSISPWDISLEDTGSGFFVTEDGYFVTAAHVVTDGNSDMRDRSVATFSDPDSIANDKPQLAKDLLSELGLSDAGVSVSVSQQNVLESFWLKWVARYLTVGRYDAKYHVATGNVKAGDSLIANGVTASLISADPYGTGRDIAVMRATVRGVPALPLAAKTPAVGQETVMVGYGYGDNPAPDQLQSATMTQGNVAQNHSESPGWTAWGTTATFRQGDSGGPVLDRNGAVMGLVSFTDVDSQGQAKFGGNYFVPSTYIRAALAADSIHLTNPVTNLTNTYYRALAEGDLQHYRLELPLLESIASRSSWDAYVGNDIASTRSRILSGADRTPPDFPSYVPSAAATSLGLIVLTMLAWLVLGATARGVAPASPHVSVALPAHGAPDPSTS